MFRSMSLIGRLSLIFFAFTLVNILLFWLATGSNQMRLIAEKASLETHRNLVSIDQKLAAIVRENAARQHADFFRSEAATTTLLAVFQNARHATPSELLEFDVVSNTNSVYLSWPQTAKKKELPPAELQNIVKTLRLKEFNNEPFYSAPDVTAYRLTVYIPFLSDRGQEILLRAVFSMESMRTELSRLMRLGAAIVVLLLLIQAALGFFLYRMVVRPLKELRIASHATGRGEFAQVAGYGDRRDEIGALISTFNKMSADIRDQKEIIRKNYEEIKGRDDVMQHELMIAQYIQKSIFPKGDYPHAAALEYKPLLAVSGDFYDVYNFSDGSTGYLICDASGHGVPAALLTMMAKSAFSGFAQRMTDPGEIMSAVNKHIASSLEMTGQYLTAFFIRIAGDEIQYCNATHPEPIVVSESVERLKSNGFYVGMMAETPFAFETATLTRKPGTKLVLYTDGISEGKNRTGELFGSERIMRIVAEHGVKTVDEIKTIILKELEAFTEGAAAEDDVTLLVLEV
jgi:sigma-B regulation protein RsbU (phosphoserine phosphatase)